MDRVPVGNYSMVFKWKASAEQTEELPILLMAHLDVVPAEEGNWKYPPFSGTITETEIWGRGTLDDKQMLLGIVIAVSRLLKEGWSVGRT